MFFDIDNDIDENESDKDENSTYSNISNNEIHDDENNYILNFEEFHRRIINKIIKKKL